MIELEKNKSIVYRYVYQVKNAFREKFPLCVFDSNIDQMTKDVNISIQLSSRQMQFLDYNDIIDTVNIIRNGVLTPEQKGLALMERCPLCKQKKRRCK